MIELNGIANLAAVIEMAKWNGKIDQKTYEDLHRELDTLERYMVAIGNATRKKTQIPYWHEVRDNKKKYPNSKVS